MSLCASVYMCFVATCWERADLLALVCSVCCEFVTFPLVSWVRCGTWLYRLLIFAPLLTLKWTREHWTLLLKSVIIGKAREIYTQLSLEQSTDYDNVKNLSLRLMSWSMKLTGRNLVIVEKKMTRLMWNLLNQKKNSWFHRPSILFWISIRTQVTCTYITWLSQPIEICSITTRLSSHVLEASIKTPKEILFCKQTGLYTLHTKWGLVVRGHLEPLCMLIVTSKTNFMFSNSTRGCLQVDDVSI